MHRLCITSDDVLNQPPLRHSFLTLERSKINVPPCFLSFRISGIPKLGMLREGLKLFISHFLLKNVQSQGPAEQAALLSERAQVATKAMEAKEAKLQM